MSHAQTSKPKVALVVAVLLITAGALTAAGYHAAGAQARAQGDALFHGTADLPGRLANQADVLPTMATRCSNCHEAAAGAPKWAAAAANNADAGRAGARSYASLLDRKSLESERARRGGPPSRFDATNLCTLLRTGIDPAQIVVPATMPRYSPTDAQCAELWTYLISR